jgi:nicotinate-nucleotide pyrophosphorylase (carboxylating)
LSSAPTPLHRDLIQPLVRQALEEDRAFDDVTTRLAVDGEAVGAAAILAGEEGVIAGIGVATLTFSELDPALVFKQYAVDGQAIARGQPLASIIGRLAPVLTAERTALNFLQRLSGIATLTQRVVKAVEGTGVTILDTRKTTPGMRLLEKYAVRCGGGQNHRQDLASAILIKDNHLAAAQLAGTSLGDLVRGIQAQAGDLAVEVEVARVREAEEALGAGAKRLLLDNMSSSEMATVVGMAKTRGAETEASGSITLDNVRQVADTGVDYISLGALTHSAPALDISLEVVAS